MNMGSQKDVMKAGVKEHWERETCGTRYADTTNRRMYFDEISTARYRLEPLIPDFAEFQSAAGKIVLEIGVGAGADFENWCRYAGHAEGVDLTDAAIALTSERLALTDTPTERYGLQLADAESLPFSENSFDVVYSWGVLHHTPDTEAAFAEAQRVLKPGGELRCMIYHVRSWTGWMLAAEQLVRTRRFRHLSARKAIYESLESPGTKAYTCQEAEALAKRAGFSDVKVWTKLSPGDLLTIRPSERYSGRLFHIVRRLYPRPLIRLLGDRFGLLLLIKASK